jgi:hypothetical protein
MSDEWAGKTFLALGDNGWEIEPGVDWDDRRNLLGPGRLAKGFHLVKVYRDMVRFGEIQLDGSCAYENTRELPDTFHQLLELVDEMNTVARRGSRCDTAQTA